MTYYRRYLACGLLGIAFSDEEDLDDKDPAVDLMSSSPLLPLDELRLMSVKMAETAYGKDHPDLKGLAGVIRRRYKPASRGQTLSPRSPNFLRQWDRSRGVSMIAATR